jgi:hypothetical protein
MSKVDDHGLFDARPSVLRASLYPLRLDRVREADITRWLAACEKAGLVALYSANGKPYVHMLDTRWKARSEAKFPKPPINANGCEQLKTDAHLDVDVVVVEDEEERRHAPASPSPARSTVSRGTRLPEGWQLPDEWLTFALAERPDWDRAHAVKVSLLFRDHWHAASGQRGVRADWAATWRNWVRRESSTPKANGAPARANGGPPWWSTDDGIKRKADELGLNIRPGESWNDLKGRINAAIEASAVRH